MTSGDRESLRRVAYGRDATAQERAAAESALRQLDEVEGKQAALAAAAKLEDKASQSDSSAEHEKDDAIENDAIQEDVEPPSFWQRSIRVAWLIPLVAGSLALGYAASIGPLNAMRESQTPTDTASPTQSAEVTDAPYPNAQPGDLAAADSWFDRPFTESDTFPDADSLKFYGIKPEDARMAVNGGDKGSVWVGRAEGTLCLVIADPADGSGASSCVERDKFARDGIALGSNNLFASWYGREVLTEPPLDSALTLPRAAESGPGDLVTAVSWFVSPALPSDEFPEPDTLAAAQIDQGDVRRVTPESTPWIKLWLAKQGADGFCFLSIDDADSSSALACAPIDEFQKSGLTLKTQGYSLFWDGTSLTVSK